MIAGGTGITPMLQIIRAALKNPLDRTKLSLIYANVNPDDILLKNELEELAAAHSNRFKVFYVLNNPLAGWTGGVGFVSKDQIEQHMPLRMRTSKSSCVVCYSSGRPRSSDNITSQVHHR
jgi:cytochrome-b5 reductase